METRNIWSYTGETWATTHLAGYCVETPECPIGKIVGKKVLVPAGAIQSEVEDACPFVQLTKEIKSASEFSRDRLANDCSRQQFGSYDGLGGAGCYARSRECSRAVGSGGREERF